MHTLIGSVKNNKEDFFFVGWSVRVRCARVCSVAVCLRERTHSCAACTSSTTNGTILSPQLKKEGVKSPNVSFLFPYIKFHDDGRPQTYV